MVQMSGWRSSGGPRDVAEDAPRKLNVRVPAKRFRLDYYPKRQPVVH